jgi:hypothetical protein
VPLRLVGSEMCIRDRFYWDFFCIFEKNKK